MQVPIYQKPLTYGCVALALLVCLSLWYYATGGHVAYTMDSLTYRDAAFHFLNGHPWMATNVATENPAQVPITVWPPAFSVLWAAISLVTHLQLDAIPQIMVPVLLGLTVVSVFTIAIILTNNPLASGAIAIASMFTPAVMAVYGHAWSETLSIPLSLLTFTAFLKYQSEPKQRLKITWLVMASLLVALANWTRYSAVVLIPLLALSIGLVPGLKASTRLLHALGASLMILLLVSPLWLRNYALTGSISGSNRGGAPKHAMERFTGDIQSILDLFENSLFDFDVLLQANLGPVLVLALGYLVAKYWKRNGLKINIDQAWCLPLLWAGGHVAFLLFARSIQKELDMDYRMLSVAMPFCMLSLALPINHALSKAPFGLVKMLTVLVIALVLYTGLGEAYRVHQNYASSKAPAWRGSFATIYRDLSFSSGSTRAIHATIGDIPANTVVLADYRALYIRYITGAKAFQMNSLEECARWVQSHPSGILLTGFTEDGFFTSGKEKWATECSQLNHNWRLVLIKGKGAHSMYADD